MMPVRLEIEAFGPYLEKQEIDFIRFRDPGLFLIYGETGSGKTAILDAITYALYGRSSGDGRGDITAMRSDFAREEMPSMVDFIFELRGKRYRFMRSVTVHTKRTGAKEYRKTQNAWREDENGEFEPLFENATLTRVHDKAVELLGLTYEQFCQVIILPQGKFERLLVAGTEEKETILSTLFRAEQWQKLSDKLCDMALQKKHEMEQLEQRTKQVLAQYACESGAQLLELTQQKKAEMERLETDAKAAEGAEAQARQAYNAAEKLEGLFVQKNAAQKELSQLEAQKQTFLEMRERLKRAADAQKVAPYRVQAQKLNEDARRREAELKQAKAKTAETITAYDAALGMLFGRLRHLKEQFEGMEEQKSKLVKELHTAQQQHQAVIDQYYGNMAYVLAEKLEEGQECPVCGSVHHEKKPQKQEGAASARDVKAAQQAVERMREQLQKQEHSQLALQAEIKTCETETQEMDLPDGITPRNDTRDTTLLLQDVRRIEQQKATTAAIEKQAAVEKEEADRQFQTAMDSYKAECAKYGFETDAQVKSYILTPEQESELTRKLEQYEAAKQAARQTLQKLEEELKEKERPDMRLVSDALSQASDMLKQALAQYHQQKSVLDMMVKAQQTVEKQATKLESERGEFTELDLFAKLLRGDMGVGLKRYVLGIMLSAVTHEANRLLKQVHGGRYQLFRTVEGAGRKRKVGLELEVFDANTGEKRNVSSLSGGEKFLVALSLSLGLSAVVQAQSGGIRMDAMFIDEGFGSLDPESIEDALGVLSGIRGSSRMVGIISHVAMLRENIEAAIEVKKTRHGSSVHLHA